MRLLIYGINYFPEETGTGKYTGELSCWLASRGHDVTVITGMPHYPQWRVRENYQGVRWTRENVDGVAVFRAPLYVPTADKSSAVKRILMETSFGVSSLRWWLPLMFSRNRFDLVISVWPPAQAGLMPLLYSTVRQVPAVAHLQDLQIDAAVELGMLNGGPIETLLFAIERFLLKRYSRVSTITEAMRQRIIKKGVKEQNVYLLPNWSDTEFIRPMEKNQLVRLRYGVQRDDVMLLYSGSMAEKQGLELIVDAAVKLQERKNLKFVLVGDGSARKRIEQAVREQNLNNILLANLVPLEELPTLLSSADIHLIVQKAAAADLVMPSKLTNIMSAGGATIATAEPGTALHDTLVENAAGVVVPPDDLDEFIDAIQHLGDAPDERMAMGQRARRYAEKFLARDSILEALSIQLKDISSGF